MPESMYEIKVQFPSGKSRIVKVFRPNRKLAENAAIWISYEEHAMYRWEQAGQPENIAPDFLPEGWGQMDDNQKLSIATEAGYEVA